MYIHVHTLHTHTHEPERKRKRERKERERSGVFLNHTHRVTEPAAGWPANLRGPPEPAAPETRLKVCTPAPRFLHGFWGSKPRFPCVCN